ncbi:MAG TPA: ABC transporter permease subunit [Candidatus Cloacimonadota bacterium]|nr:ABC transporter permease subunit [Candidatus Cloacimonadota bacterium]HOH79826.1 ABC transporter permease subunit [Candidatus Cloacimonadota bacterium]
MSIIGKVARRDPKTRALNLAMHLILILGSLTMLYPFALMLSSSIKSAVDGTRMELIPPYLYQDAALYQKYLESRYNEESSRLMDNYPGSWISFAEVKLPDNPDPAVWQDFKAFLKQSDYSVYHYYVAEHYGRGVYPLAQRQYRKILRSENSNSLVEFNKRYGTGAVSWEEIVVEEKEITRRLFTSSSSGYLGRFRKFKEQTPLWQRLFVDPDGCFVNSELIPSAGGDLAKFNGLNGTSYQAWTDIRLPSECPPEGHHLREPWLRYARAVLNIHQLGLTDSALPAFRAMLKDKYGSIGLLNLTWKLDLSSFEQVTIPQQLPDSGALVEDLSFFIQNQAQPEQIRVHSLAHNWRDWLRRKYGSLASLNLARRDSLPSWDAIAFPVREMDYFSFLERKAAIRWEFISRNYKMALDQMLSDARSLRNTGIYVLLSILLAVTVNPLAAYALSRFKPRFSYQLIMLFMLTMAFPAMVMGIPNFLMLKRLNLLNTFWALVLPAAADGYFIFLLKGFFDSLPREIYESASLDGASEFRLFWQFTLWLSKPILAVIALGAFNAAYRNFLFAFIVCQDQSMWTLMVHIYNLMQRASVSVGYAALVIAAIPTLAVFIFFQNIIIKGIVVPMEK